MAGPNGVGGGRRRPQCTSSADGPIHGIDQATVHTWSPKELVVERAEIVWKALRIFQTANVDFADCLIERSAAAAGCEKTMTFDRGAAKIAGMTLLA